MVAGEKDKSGQSIVSKRINEIKHGKIEIDKMIANVVSPAANVARQGAVQARAVSPALFELRDHGGCVFIWGHESDWWKNLGPELQVANALSEWLDKFKPSSDGGQNC